MVLRLDLLPDLLYRVDLTNTHTSATKEVNSDKRGQDSHFSFSNKAYSLNYSLSDSFWEKKSPSILQRYSLCSLSVVKTVTFLNAGWKWLLSFMSQWTFTSEGLMFSFKLLINIWKSPGQWADSSNKLLISELY